MNEVLNPIGGWSGTITFPSANNWSTNASTTTSWTVVSKSPTVIEAEEKVSMTDIQIDPAAAEQTIKEALALKIAHTLLDEDLILIQTDDDVETLTKTIRARIKLIQE